MPVRSRSRLSPMPPFDVPFIRSKCAIFPHGPSMRKIRCELYDIIVHMEHVLARGGDRPKARRHAPAGGGAEAPSLDRAELEARRPDPGTPSGGGAARGGGAEIRAQP